jgi:tetratricopeptide (TPR) repeat protein
VESDPKYENINPGTVTVEGFGLECWDHVRPQADTVTFSRGQLPEVEAEKLLRRTDELSHNSYEFGSDFALDEAYPKEFAGDLGNTSSIDDDFMTQYRFTRTPVTNGLASGRVRNICHLLNRDIFTDFKASPSIILTTWMSHTCRNMFLRQMIVARELALRLWYHSPHYLTSGDTGSFTSKALASLIIADLWFANVRHKAIDLNLPYAQNTQESREEQARAETVKCRLLPRKPQDPKEQARAEFLKCTADEALEKRRYGEAVDLYTESLNIDSFCTLAHAKKSAALLSQEKPAEALMNAIGATMADPRYAGGWVQRANINLKLGNAKKARNEYERAITVAGHGATDFMRRGLADANAKIDADLKAIESEPKKDTWHRLWTSYHDQDYDTSDKVICIYSLVDEQQVEGLLFFAQHMAWPYITETQDSIKTAYSLLRRGQSQPAQVSDWLLGLSLPGQWLAMNIMSTLIVCTPSIAGPLRRGHPSNCGISLPKQSHWRVRTVLGRVLSCLPGVTSLCGWVGPCPPVEFISLSLESKPRYILLKAPPVPPVEHTPDGECRAGKFFLHDPYDSTLYPKPGEDIRAFAAEMQDQNNWVIPERPNREFTACTMQAIRLEKLPLDSSIADKKANGEMTDEEAENNTGYRASIVFKMDNSDDPITYTLFNAPHLCNASAMS